MAPLVLASAAANGVCCTTLSADFLQLDLERRYDVVIAAEVAYDRERFPELAEALTRHLEAGGSAVIADGYRTDTRALYHALAARGYPAHAIDVRVEIGHRPDEIRSPGQQRKTLAQAAAEERRRAPLGGIRRRGRGHCPVSPSSSTRRMVWLQSSAP